jgi:hypothetical protein
LARWLGFSEIVTRPIVAFNSCLEMVGQTFQEMQRVAGRGVDGTVSRMVHILRRAPAMEVDPMVDMKYSRQSGDVEDLELGDRLSLPTISKSSDSWQVVPPPCSTGAKPEIYGREVVTGLLEKTAYFVVFSRDNPQRPDVPIFAPENRSLLVGMDLYKDMHRFDVVVEPPTQATGLRASSFAGQFAAQLRARFRVTPADFAAAPGREPPPTPLDPSQPQQFVSVDGEFRFDDRPSNGFHGFGTDGRTFPVNEGGQQKLRMGEVIHVRKGYGKLEGSQGFGVVTGTFTPPDTLKVVFVLRIIDPARKLFTTTSLNPLQRNTIPDPDAVFLTLRGEADPDHPPTLIKAADGGVRGAQVYERLRLAHVDFDLGNSRKGIRTKATFGQIVANLNYTIFFKSRNSEAPDSFEMQNGVFTFCDSEGRTIGTLLVASIAGSASVIQLRGAPTSVLLFAGFGPISGGAGQFSSAEEGMVAVNGALSIYPSAFSNFYVLRVVDPDGRFRSNGRVS